MGGCQSSKKENKNQNPNNGLRMAGQANRGDIKLNAKVVLIGNSGVGKTSIALRYKEGRFNDNPRATVGASYFQKQFAFRDGSKLRLHIWDTGGQDKFKSVAPLYYKGAHAALVVYSIIDENSYRCLDEWLKQLEEHGNIPKMIKIIIGNKNDVDKEERKVEARQGR